MHYFRKQWLRASSLKVSQSFCSPIVISSFDATSSCSSLWLASTRRDVSPTQIIGGLIVLLAIYLASKTSPNWVFFFQEMQIYPLEHQALQMFLRFLLDRVCIIKSIHLVLHKPLNKLHSSWSKTCRSDASLFTLSSSSSLGTDSLINPHSSAFLASVACLSCRNLIQPFWA